ncbi:NYN domain-containing protein [Candidatus Pacearchaeota archaeon]|nr:NYN domain-containing protein [Candidatus Pacearchaeota archaeon]
MNNQKLYKDQTNGIIIKSPVWPSGNAGSSTFNKIKSAIVFIDGNNWYHNLKTIVKPSKIDLRKLAVFICNKFNLTLKEIRYYNSIPDISDNEINYHKHINFLSGLAKEKVIVKTRKLSKLKKEKGIDVLIASDMIRNTIIDKKCDVCILISGDADFIPVMEIIKDLKKEAITAMISNGYARELMQGRFRFLILKAKDILDNCLKTEEINQK